MANKNMSALDAFLALEDLNDDILVMPRKPIKEGKAFNIRDMQEMEEAKKFVEETHEKPVELEVVDPNAESEDDIKENREYLGKIAIKCSSCGYVRLIDLEELQKTDQEGDDGKPIYNPDLECLQCHQTGSGYTLVGPVSAVPQEEEAPISNDSLTDDAKFENDIEPEEEPVETGDKESEEEVEAEEETNVDEVAEDDTADMENTLGNEFTGDDVSPDDTVEEEPTTEQTEEDSLTKNKSDDVDPDLKEVEVDLEDEEDEKKKDEALEGEEVSESIEIIPTKVSDLLHLFIEPDSIGEIVVYDLDSDNPEKEIYKGSFVELPQSILDANLASYSSGEGNLIIRASLPQKDARTVEQVLGLFDDDFNADISIVDATTDDELAFGTPLSCISDAGQNTFEAFEAPALLELKIRAVELPEQQKEEYAEDFDGTSDEDRLIENVLIENKFKTYRAKVYGTNEYWLADSIRNKEDLDIIFENFIKGHDYLVKDFKKVTGFKEALDILMEEKKNPGKQISEDEALEAAKAKLKENDKLIAVIYGYVTDGGFKSLPDGNLMEIETDRELRWATELVDRDYQPKGSVRVLYRRSVEEKLDFKTRKELTEAILDCQKNNINYTVSRSDKDGYRYTLIKEAKKDDELPVDPEAAKLQVHTMLNNLVTDEIEAINGYEEAKAEILDAPINHKDAILDTVDHIEDEEKEHVDELIDATKEIPFDKENETPAVEEIPAVEEEPEDEEVEFDEKAFEGFINKWFAENSEDKKLFETLAGSIDDQGVIILEGKLKFDEGKEEDTSFTLTPKKDLNEDLMDSKKVNTYTITSVSLPESIVYTESLFGFEIAAIESWLAKYQKETGKSWEELLNELDNLMDLYAEHTVETSEGSVKKEELGISFIKGTLENALRAAINGERLPVELEIEGK